MGNDKYPNNCLATGSRQEDAGRGFEYNHDEDGRRQVKYENGTLVEANIWLDLTSLAGFHDGEHGFRFLYEDDETRTPYAMQREDGVVASLYFDQVGSLRVVADMQGDVIKETLCDPFGGIIEDTNPDLRIPLGFAADCMTGTWASCGSGGGANPQDSGFGRRSFRRPAGVRAMDGPNHYDTFTGRWTAPDPMGDAGGDSD